MSSKFFPSPRPPRGRLRYRQRLTPGAEVQIRHKLCLKRYLMQLYRRAAGAVWHTPRLPGLPFSPQAKLPLKPAGLNL